MQRMLGHPILVFCTRFRRAHFVVLWYRKKGNFYPNVNLLSYMLRSQNVLWLLSKLRILLFALKSVVCILVICNELNE